MIKPVQPNGGYDGDVIPEDDHPNDHNQNSIRRQNTGHPGIRNQRKKKLNKKNKRFNHWEKILNEALNWFK